MDTKLVLALGEDLAGLVENQQELIDVDVCPTRGVRVHIHPDAMT